MTSLKNKICLVDDCIADSDIRNLESIGCMQAVDVLREVETDMDSETLETIVPDEILRRLLGYRVVIVHGSLVDEDGTNISGLLCDWLESHGRDYVVMSGGLNCSALCDADTSNKQASVLRNEFYANFPRFVENFISSDGTPDYGLLLNSVNAGNQSDRTVFEPDSVRESVFIEVLASEPDESLMDNVDKADPEAVLVFNLDTTDSRGRCELMRKAMLIRLSVSQLGTKALLPFIFVGSRSVREYIDEESVIKPRHPSAMVLLTEGVSLVRTLTSPGETVELLKPERYKTGFIDRIKINPSAESGNHTIANEWGAYRMAMAITGGMPTKDHSLNDHVAKIIEKDPLYLKYLQLSSLSGVALEGLFAAKSVALKPMSLQTLQSRKYSGKRVLLIDDQDAEWEIVLKSLLGDNISLDVWGRQTGRICSRRETDFLDVSQDELSGIADYDLVLLDLRLGGSLEEDIFNPKELSGTRILEKIMNCNRGTQVIVFTSSNKAWNMQYVLNLGAAGYYIKESPAMAVAYSETTANLDAFVQLMLDCFDRKYLVDVVNITRRIEEMDDSTEVFDKIITQAAIAEEMTFHAAETQHDHDFDMAFISLEQVFEIMKYEDNNHQIKPVYECIEDLTGFNVGEYTQFRNRLVHKFMNAEPGESKKKLIRLWNDMPGILADF